MPPGRLAVTATGAGDATKPITGRRRMGSLFTALAAAAVLAAAVIVAAWQLRKSK